ncbi:DUF4349 domain-containing protein [Alkalibacter saccharofermentans]|uniref:Putative zinc-finger n=1 Tax=Alkalibacter saccharofermentans DSM 14828 TaxID=1120975 RepID=A0A1M4X8D9_9FIRM|nr:DUF4349 domain-containing protein [Alkalibacter saccharofermentans]SHE89691.1 Putative zinc-finger [Alkalibacter saccharofermentans DSM 14828]
MDHERYIDLISRDVDKDLSGDEKKELDHHLQSCEECSSYYQDLMADKAVLDGMVVHELKDKDKKQIENNMKSIKNRMPKMKKYLPYAAGLIIVLAIAGTTLSNLFMMGRSDDSASDSGSGYPGFESPEQWEGDAPQEDIARDSDGGNQSAAENVEISREFDVSKIVYRGNISLYTEDYKETADRISTLVLSQGGFIQEASANYYDVAAERSEKAGYMIVRVPSEGFSETMKEIESYGDAMRSGIASTNITQQYQDIEGELDSYLIQEERLLDYLSQAESINDMLSIESELTRVRREINHRSTMLKNWDKEVAYSTININIYERTLPTSKVQTPFEDFGRRIREAFIQSVNYLLKLIVDASIMIVRLMPFAVVALGTAYIVRILLSKYKK